MTALPADPLALYEDDLFAAIYLPNWHGHLAKQQGAIIDQLVIAAGLLPAERPVRVLDAAAGTGAAALHLARIPGLEVAANERSPALRAALRRQAAHEGRELLEHSARWSELPAEHGTETFHLVVSLGSSFAHCEGEAGLDEAVAAMSAVLQPGGLLLVDAKRHGSKGEELAPDGSVRQSPPRPVTFDGPDGTTRNGVFGRWHVLQDDRSLVTLFYMWEPVGRPHVWWTRTWPHTIDAIERAAAPHGLDSVARDQDGDLDFLVLTKRASRR